MAVILSDTDIRNLICNDNIQIGNNFIESQIQPSSFDITIKDKAYFINHSIPPGDIKKSLNLIKNTYAPVSLKTNRIPKNKIVIVELNESLNLPYNIAGKCSPKSSIGRCDILVRIISETGDRFDSIPKGYKGKLYAEIIAQSFNVLLPENCPISQIRFEDRSKIEIHNKEIYVDIDLKRAIIGYKSFPVYSPIIAHIDLNIKNNKDTFWIPINKRDVTHQSLLLEKDKFYLLSSHTPIEMPSDKCGELLDFDSSFGEIRLHYAGFIDPGFNGDLVYEIRPFIDTLIYHKMIIGKLKLFSMLKEPSILYGDSMIHSNYQHQRGSRLSKYFK